MMPISDQQDGSEEYVRPQPVVNYGLRDRQDDERRLHGGSRLVRRGLYPRRTLERYRFDLGRLARAVARQHSDPGDKGHRGPVTRPHEEP